MMMMMMILIFVSSEIILLHTLLITLLHEVPSLIYSTTCNAFHPIQLHYYFILAPNSRLYIQNLLKESEERMMSQILSAFERQNKVLSKIYSFAKSSSALPIKHPKIVDCVQEIKFSINNHEELVSFDGNIGKDNIFRNIVSLHFYNENSLFLLKDLFPSD